MAHAYFNNPNKARSSMGRGSRADYDVDDAAGWLQQGILGFKTKAKAGGETIFLPIFPGPIRTPDGEDTDYFRSVQVAEFGLEKNYQSWIANPSDRPDLPFNEIPVVMLHRDLDAGCKRNDPAYLEAARYFIPHGQYKQPDFRWPTTWVVFQAAVYRQPSLEDHEVRSKLKDKLRAIAGPPDKDGKPTTDWVFAEPEFKTVWIKGTGRDAISAALHGVDAAGNFTMPIEAFAGGAPCAFRTAMFRDKEDKPNMGIEVVDLASMGLRAPTREEVMAKWVPWEKVFRKITYAEQVGRLAKYFGNKYVGMVIPDLHAHVQHVQQAMSPAAPPPAQGQPGQPQGASWGAPGGAAPAQGQGVPAPAMVRTFQPPAETPPAAQQPAQTQGQPSWGVPAAPPATQAPAAAPPAAASPPQGQAAWGAPPASSAQPQQQAAPPQGATQVQGAPVTAQPPSTVPMTPAEMAARFGGYRQADGQPKQ